MSCACVYGGLVDAVAGLLDGPRARGAFVLRSVLRAPWSLRIDDGAALSTIVMVTGVAHLQLDGRAPMALGPGDVAVVTGGAPYTVADAPGREPQALIGPGQVCTTPAGTPLEDLGELGVRTWGNDPGGPDVMITGTYQLGAETSRRLLAALPPALVQPVAGRDAALLDWLAAEISREEPGQVAVLDRLVDLVLVSTVRTWFARPDAQAPGWYAAHADPALAPVLAVIDHQPHHPWTVATLAAVAGLSRAALARRFTTAIGQGPMTFLTHRRLDLAADLLLEPGATLTSVARRVGYSSPYALSAAFTRVRGLTPRQHRTARGAQPATAATAPLGTPA